MAPPRKLPDDATLKALLGAGLSHVEIGRRYGVTHHTVGRHAARLGFPPRRLRHSQLIPWTVREEHAELYPHRMLRLMGRLAIGEPVPDSEMVKLTAWLAARQEDGTVVDYDYETGWHYVPRVAEDGDDVIRRPVGVREHNPNG